MSGRPAGGAEEPSIRGEVERPPSWAQQPPPPPAKVRRTREDLVQFLLAQQSPPLRECHPEALGAGLVPAARRGSWGSRPLAWMEPRPAARTSPIFRGARLAFPPTQTKVPKPASRAQSTSSLPTSPPVAAQTCVRAREPSSCGEQSPRPRPGRQQTPPARRGAALRPGAAGRAGPACGAGARRRASGLGFPERTNGDRGEMKTPINEPTRSRTRRQMARRRRPGRL